MRTVIQWKDVNSKLWWYRAFMKITLVLLLLVSSQAFAQLNSPGFPVLEKFASNGAFNSGMPFTDETPYWAFNGDVYGNAIAPAKGIVASVEVSKLVPGTTSITLMHTDRLSSKIAGISGVTVRAGDFVAAGQIIGIFVPSSSIVFQTLLDSNPICPLSFVSSNFRKSLFSNPCL